MHQLTEPLDTYISVTFLPDVKSGIYMALHTIRLLSDPGYEDQYVQLILNDDIPNDAKSDLFLFTLNENLKSILEQHGVILNEESDIRLSELSELVYLLYNIQAAENYRDISYKVYSDNSSKKIFISLLTTYTSIETYRAHELIYYVDDLLIKGIRDLIDHKDNVKESSIATHIVKIKDFFKFINNSDCLGLTLFHFGCINLTFNDLLEFTNEEQVVHVDNLMLSNPPQAALDCLSLLLLGTDTYLNPIGAFKQDPYKFTSTLENVTKIEFMMNAMLADFNLYLEAKKQEQELNKEVIVNDN